MSHLCSPLRYPGGKNCIFPFVSQMLRENDLIGCSYAEPYAGGAGLALRLLFEEYVDKIYINDLDKSIFSFWHALLNRNEDFCSWLDRVEVSMDSWNYYKSVQNNPLLYDSFELAKSTFFLNRTNVSGVIIGGVIGGRDQKGKYKIDARFNKLDLIARIDRLKSFRHRILLSNLDGVKFVKKLDKKNDDIFIYMDPPYFLKGAELYLNAYDEADHANLAQHVSDLRQRWMISYDYHDYILNLYSKKKMITYRLSQSASNRTGNEVLIFAKDVKFKESMSYLTDALKI